MFDGSTVIQKGIGLKGVKRRKDSEYIALLLYSDKFQAKPEKGGWPVLSWKEARALYPFLESA